MNEIKITPEEIGKAAELIRKVAEGTTQPAEPLTSWEIAKIFQSTHTRIFNRISRFYNAEASEDEKKEFRCKNHPLSGKGVVFMGKEVDGLGEDPFRIRDTRTGRNNGRIYPYYDDAVYRIDGREGE